MNKIGIIGSGAMGSGIGYVTAAAGYQTGLYDPYPEMLEKARAYHKRLVDRSVEKGRLTLEAANSYWGRVVYTEDIATVLHDANLVIESVPEKMALKKEILQQVEQVAPPTAVLGSNTSSLPITELASAVSDPGRVIGTHFFNPAPVMKLVEVVQGPHVSDETMQISLALCERLDKVGVHLKKEVDGFLLNRILGAIAREALWLLEMGVASFEDIDRAQVHGAGHPMGTFRLMDLTGIDLAYTMAMETFQATGDWRDRYRSGLPTGTGPWDAPPHRRRPCRCPPWRRPPFPEATGLLGC